MTDAPSAPPVEEESAAIAAFLGRHGIPGLMDVHTHFMPDNVLAKVWQYFEGAGPKIGRRWPIAYRHSEVERIEILRAFGVRRFTSLNYPHRPGMAQWLNDWSAQFAGDVPDCLHSGTFYPEEGAADYVARALDAGARVFKCHVQVGEFSPADPLLDPVWQVLEDAGAPTVIHCGSGPVAGEHTGVTPVREVLTRHPRLRLVIAHMGMPEYAEFLDLATEFEGVLLDTTMFATDFTERLMPIDRALLPRLAEAADRILLGTDFPNIPYPYLHQLEALEGLGLGSDWLRAVCWDNPVRELGLEADPVVDPA
ncbi:MAG: amidohydrolase [Micrococcales bacterium]|nr:amidohydrolase [Micrococcales bacterium]